MAADSKNLDPIIKYCAVGRQLGYAGYLSLDALTFLDAANIRKSPNTKRLQQEAYRCWMIGLLFSAVSGAYSLYNLRQQQARIDKKDGEGAIATKRIEKYAFHLLLLFPGGNTEDFAANKLISGNARLSISSLSLTFATSRSPPPPLASPASMTDSSV